MYKNYTIHNCHHRMYIKFIRRIDLIMIKIRIFVDKYVNFYR